MKHKRTTELRYPGLWRGCVGAWAPCLGPTGLTLRDWSGFGNHGANTNGAAFATSSGRYAISLTGSSSQWVNAGSATQCQLQTLSCSFWVNPGTQVASFSFTGVLGFGRNGWQVGHDRVNNTIVFAKSFVASTTQTAIAVTQNTWAHIAITCQDVAGTKTVVFYKNGVIFSTSSAFVQTFSFGESTSQLAIGREAGPTTPQNTFFTGFVDDARVYSRVISQQEITMLASRRGIAYELAPLRRSSVQVGGFKAAWVPRQKLIVGGGL